MKKQISKKEASEKYGILAYQPGEEGLRYWLDTDTNIITDSDGNVRYRPLSNLEKIAKVFEELGCTVKYDIDDEKYIEVHYEMITNRTEHEFTAALAPLGYNINGLDVADNINWELELKYLFAFDDELDYIERDFCRYYIEDLLKWTCFYADNVENIAHNWDDEKECIKAEFTKFCTDFKSLIKKYSEVK